MKKLSLAIVLLSLIFILLVSYRYSSMTEEVIIESFENRVENNQIEEAVEITETENTKPDVIEKEQKSKKIICIDPGHQQKGDYTTEPIGPNSDKEKPKVSNGAIGISTNKPEYELTLEVSLKLKDRLEEKGFVVVLTRKSHDVNISNSERAKIANMNDSDIFIRIHADQREPSEFNGISVLCPSEENKYTSKIYDDSDKLANLLLESLIAETDATNQGISYRDDISGFNWSEVPVALVELGFMSNPLEDEKMNTDVYQNKLVDGMLKGILEYFNH
ncbi:MAG: N-acetylmuramoyl-L-alanine amidase [Clostridiales bacterium]|nr:N-acetylmuramoyl-L-alanine amidase [Clostridiales bacterium]